MIGLGLGLAKPRARSAYAPYAVGGALPMLVLDFETQTYLGATPAVTRASSKTVLAASGQLETVAADTLAFDWDGGRRALLLETAATRLNGYVSARSAWATSISGAVLTNLSEAALGQFGGMSIASPGANYARAKTDVSVMSGQVYAAKFLWKPGTSGMVRFGFRSTTSGTESAFAGGAVGTLAMLADAAGTITLYADRIRGGYRETVLVFTPNDTGTCQMAIGPYSTVVGETVNAYAWQIEAGSADSSWILGDAGVAVIRAADVFSPIALTPATFAAGQGMRVAARLRSLTSGVKRVVQLDAGSAATQQMIVRNTASSAFAFDAYDGSALQASLPLAGAEGVEVKIAASAAPDAFRAALNGVAATADTSGSYTAPQWLRLGNDAAAGNAPGTLRLFAVSLFAQALSNAQLIGATQ